MNLNKSELYEPFRLIVSGEIQAPYKKYMVDDLFFTDSSSQSKNYCELYLEKMSASPFWKHYCSSIPYVLEEQCRIGITLSRLSELNFTKDTPLTFYEPEAASGVDAIVLAEFTKGKIYTLTNTGSLPESNDEFFRLAHHEYSSSIKGRYLNIDLDVISKKKEIFIKGFDVIYSNVVFQFTSLDRFSQILHIKKLLKNDGVFICLEKCLLKNKKEYSNREIIKDKYFKSMYFSKTQLEWKKNNIISKMESFQVEYDVMVENLKKHFQFVYLLWNSANFYEFMATNSKKSANLFLENLSPPYVPRKFQFEKFERL